MPHGLARDRDVAVRVFETEVAIAAPPQLIRLKRAAAADTSRVSMSETISSRGFSSASAYCLSCPNAASRSARWPCTPRRSDGASRRRPSRRRRCPWGAPLEAVRLARRVCLDRRRLAQQPAQVDEVLLRRRALLQRGGRHLAMNSCGVIAAFSLVDDDHRLPQQPAPPLRQATAARLVPISLPGGRPLLGTPDRRSPIAQGEPSGVHTPSWTAPEGICAPCSP